MADKHWKYIAYGLNIFIYYLGLLGRLPHKLKLPSLRAGAGAARPTETTNHNYIRS